MTSAPWPLIVAALAAAGCRGSDAPPAKVAEATPAAPAPVAPAPTLELPPHTRVVDPDLLFGLCVLPQLYDAMRCTNTFPAVAVLHARQTDRRYAWVAVRCDEPAFPSTEVARVLQEVVTFRSKHWSSMAATSNCGAERPFLITIALPASKGGSLVVSGTSDGVSAQEVKTSEAAVESFQAGVQTIENQLGVTLDLVTIRTSLKSGAPGISSAFWPLDAKPPVSDL